MTFDEYLAKHPFLQESAKVYNSIEEAVSNLTKEKIAVPPEHFLKRIADEGLPLLQEKAVKEKVIADSAVALEKIVQEIKNLPVTREMQETAEILAKAFGEKKELASALMELIIIQDMERLSEKCKEISVAEPFILLVGWNIVSSILPGEIKKRTAWEKVKYRRNYCPVCGRRPVMGQLRKEANGKARFLSCDGCHTQWPFDRTGCVYCGNDDLRKIEVMEPANNEKIRLYACKECKSYLKTYVEEDEEEIFLKDWATMHFDILGEEAGFHKQGSVIMG